MLWIHPAPVRMFGSRARRTGIPHVSQAPFLPWPFQCVPLLTPAASHTLGHRSILIPTRNDGVLLCIMILSVCVQAEVIEGTGRDQGLTYTMAPGAIGGSCSLPCTFRPPIGSHSRALSRRQPSESQGAVRTGYTAAPS